MEATISVLHTYPSFVKHNHRTSLLPLTSSQSSLFLRHIPCKLYAIRPESFEFSGVNSDGDGSRKTRKKSVRKWWTKQRKRQWWDFEDGDNDRLRGDDTAGSFGQVVGSIWIFKVLRSYGLFLPFILLSLLLATGSKAFLIAFSIPLGLSLVFVVFQKLWEWQNESLEPQKKRRTRSLFSLEDMFLMEEDDDFEEEIKQKRRNQRRDYRSWKAGNNKDNTNRTNNFRGWDDLVITKKETWRGRRKDPRISTPKVPIEEKIERSLEERDLPLQLRLLIGLFPFLGSWTEML